MAGGSAGQGWLPGAGGRVTIAGVNEPVPPSLRPPAIPEVHVVWITAGLGCDGDTVSMTAATHPSIEELVLGAIPAVPRVRLHNPVLAFENGDDFMRAMHQAAEG